MLFRGMTNDPHALRKLVALNIRIRRVELDITQEELAHRAELSQAYLSEINAINAARLSIPFKG